MFCLGCGAETPPRAARCPVCGRELSGAPGAGEVQWTVSPTSSAAALPVPRGSIAYSFPAPTATSAVAVASPSIAAGDLDAAGFPRDTNGRVLLIAAVLMALDLLVPWIDQFGHSVAPAQLGLPMLLVVAALAAAVVPLVRPAFRAQPSLAVIPVIVGSMLLSLSIVFWGIVSWTAFQAAQTPPDTLPDGTLAAQTPALGPDVGIYLFILGCFVLIVTGYHQFLEAARGSAPAGAVAVPLAVLPPPLAVVTPSASDKLPGAPGVLAPDEADAAGAPAASGSASAIAPAIEKGEAATRSAAAGAGADTPRVALPGSAAWHEAPKQPAYSRPSPLGGGWQRQPRGRR